MLYPQRPHGRGQEFDSAPQSFGFDGSEAISLEALAGSTVFFNGYPLHKSQRILSGEYRRALVNRRMCMQSLLPWLFESELGHKGLSAATADNRCAHPVRGDDPYVQSGFEVPAEAVCLRPYEKD